jgi:DNA-binding transcriptional ArsR family regulator
VSDDRDTCELLCLDLPMAERVRASLPPVEQLEAAAAGARALGDRTRLGIALALRDSGRACVCDLAWIVGRHEKLVSHHVRQLKGAALARSERDHRLALHGPPRVLSCRPRVRRRRLSRRVLAGAAAVGGRG